MPLNQMCGESASFTLVLFKNKKMFWFFFTNLYFLNREALSSWMMKINYSYTHTYRLKHEFNAHYNKRGAENVNESINREWFSCLCCWRSFLVPFKK